MTYERFIMIVYVIKTVLLSVVFLTAAALGVRASAEERRKVARLEGLLSFVRHVKRRVEYYAAPTSEIYESFSCEPLEDCGFTKILRAGDRDDDENPFCRALKECRDAINLDEELFSALYDFGANLGTCISEDQIVRCVFLEEYLGAEIEKKHSALPGRTRLYSSLGISIGMMIVILLW